MLHLQRYVGTAPGTTTFSYNGRKNGMAGAWPTQAVYQPTPNQDNVEILLPPNQWVTGPVTMSVSSPAAQRTMGPVTNDYDANASRHYQPVRRGWIANASGPPIYTLQGALGNTADDAVKWSIAASIISAVALATTTVIAIMRFKQGR